MQIPENIEAYNAYQARDFKSAALNGYYDEDKRPLRCARCDHDRFYDYRTWTDESGVVEYIEKCRKCKLTVGHWSYGLWL